MQRRLQMSFIVLGLFLTLQGYQNCSGVQKSVGFSNDTSSKDVTDSGTPDDSSVPKLIKETVQVAAPTDQVDVLIVMDNSKSMAVEQGNMAARFSNFLAKLNGLNWHLGIVTTDVSVDAALRDGRLVQFKNTSDFFLNYSMSSTAIDAAFSSTIMFNPNGDGKEQGIKSTYRFIERYSDAAAINNTHRAMLRPTAALSVILVTDSNETPNGAATEKNDGAKLVEKVKATFGASKPFVFNSIVVKSNDSTCLKADGNEAYGKSYEQLSKLTAGVVGTVCATDYAAQLQDIGEVTAYLVKSIQLKCVPEDMDQNGTPDLEIRNSNNVLVSDYTLQGQQARFNNALAPGSYSVQYYCK